MSEEPEEVAAVVEPNPDFVSYEWPDLSPEERAAAIANLEQGERAFEAMRTQRALMEARLECLKLAVEQLPKGVNAGHVLRRAGTFYEWVKTGIVPADADQG